MPSPLTQRSQLLVATLSFLAGACATVATQSAASTSPAAAVETSTPEPATVEGATVVAIDAAPIQFAPSGKARIWHLARGQNAYLGKLEMDANGAVPQHRDTTEEFIHVLEGSGTLTIEGQEYALEPGSTVYMPANARVSFQNGDAKMVALQVFAGPEPAAKYEAWNSSAP